MKPVVFGVFGRGAPEQIEGRVERGRARLMARSGAAAPAVWCSDDRTSQVVRFGGSAARDPHGRGFVFAQGVIYPPDRTCSDALELADFPAAYLQQGLATFNRLRGEFSLVFVSADGTTAMLATDPIGSHVLYWRVDENGLIFSSDLAVLLAATPAASSLDLRAVADYVTVGAVLGRRTLAHGVEVLEPGTMLTFDRRTNQVETACYFDVARLFAERRIDREQYLQDVETTFQNAVTRALSGTGALGLSLSGGLDSRAILSAANGRAHTLRTYTLGVTGCADQVIAERMSRIAGTTHTFFELNDTYLKDFLPNMARMVSMTDGLYLSHGLTEMLALDFLSGMDIDVLLRGHGGELAKAHLAWPLHTDTRVYEMNSRDAFIEYLSMRANYLTPNVPLTALVRPELAPGAGRGTVDSFAESLKHVDLAPAAACSYLYLKELHRRFTVPSLDLFRTVCEVRTPFVDRDFLAALLSGPPQWRDSTAIHQRLTKMGIPRLLRVRNSNTGAPASAPAAVEFVLDKFNTAFKRLNVHGYRHYHNFDAWMRRMLIDSVEAELLQPSARVQAFVAPDTLRRLVSETRDGQSDHAYLLQVLLIIELWQRENDISHAA